jgi:hypothetical protein
MSAMGLPLTSCEHVDRKQEHSDNEGGENLDSRA